MSIHEIVNKIKGSHGIDNTTIMYLFVVVGVGIASFGLGRLSVAHVNTSNKDITITQAASSASFVTSKSSKQTIASDIATQDGRIEKNYVASKHGKLYYTSGCAGAKRIKPENEVWFSTSSDAEKSGYTLSTSCK